MSTKLTPFEGKDVVKATVRIMKAGDGLSEALSFEPIELEHGDEAFFVLRGIVRDVDFPPDGKIEEPGEVPPLVRRHTVDALEIALVGRGDVDELLERNRARLDEQRRAHEAEEQRKRDAEAGLLRIPGTESPEELQAAHDAEEHTALVDGCPACDAERDADEAGD